MTKQEEDEILMEIIKKYGIYSEESKKIIVAIDFLEEVLPSINLGSSSIWKPFKCLFKHKSSNICFVSYIILAYDPKNDTIEVDSLNQERVAHYYSPEKVKLIIHAYRLKTLTLYREMHD